MKLRIRKPRGNILALTLIFAIPVMLAVAGVAVDIGLLLLTRSELHRTTDAVALAVARDRGRTADELLAASTSAQAQTIANNNATRFGGSIGDLATEMNPCTNSSNTIRVVYGTTCAAITWGIWDESTSSWSYRMTTDNPIDDPNVDKFNAVESSATQRIPSFFFKLIGMASLTTSSQSVAIAGPLTTLYKDTILLPMAIAKCMADDPSWYDPANPFRIGSSYHYQNCTGPGGAVGMAGQWTSFAYNTNDVTTIRNIITDGYDQNLSVGDPTWIDPGTKNTIYAAGTVNVADLIGQTVKVPVVDAILNDVTHDQVPVYSFVCLHITNSVGGNQKYVEGYFEKECAANGNGGISPYGVYAPVRLVF